MGRIVEAYLFYVQGDFDFGDVSGDVALERGDVDGLAYGSGHFVDLLGSRNCNSCCR